MQGKREILGFLLHYTIKLSCTVDQVNRRKLKFRIFPVSVKQDRRAVYNAKSVGLQVGVFFIVGYLGIGDQTILDTLRFASMLPLDYLSFNLPYPIPGTDLFQRVKVNAGWLGC